MARCTTNHHRCAPWRPFAPVGAWGDGTDRPTAYAPSAQCFGAATSGRSRRSAASSTPTRTCAPAGAPLWLRIPFRVPFGKVLCAALWGQSAVLSSSCTLRGAVRQLVDRLLWCSDCGSLFVFDKATAAVVHKHTADGYSLVP